MFLEALDLVGDEDVDREDEGVIGNGAANSRRATVRFVGDFVGDLVGEDGGPGNFKEEMEPLGDADARVRVRAEIFGVMGRSGKSAAGTCGIGDTSECN